MQANEETLELSFEFLMTKNVLKWIQIRSDKAMMMTVCLQSLVNELLNQKSDSLEPHQRQTALKPTTRISFLKRDETNQFKPLDASPDPVVIPEAAPRTQQQQQRNSVRNKIREISTTVFFRTGQNRVHNEAFEGIGDEDL